MSTIITHRQFPGYHKYEMELAGRPLTLEVGKLAELANAAVMVGYGDTRVLVCATASARPRDGIDFFPLSVDFEEKMYSVGRIPGSFNRREGRPGEKGILTSRVIDRPIRPLFPYDFRNDVSIMATVMSVDHDCSPEIAALIGTSAALAISDIPWNGPVGAVKMGLVGQRHGFYRNMGTGKRSFPSGACLQKAWTKKQTASAWHGQRRERMGALFPPFTGWQCGMQKKARALELPWSERPCGYSQAGERSRSFCTPSPGATRLLACI